MFTRANVRVINLENIKGNNNNNNNTNNLDVRGKWKSAQKIFDSDNILRARKAKIISNRLSELRLLSHD